ncbi:hypothetical protein HK414_12995 [Ramlibacter terrae]|uniref:Uncharacterized protein n=1 Tax=Ramlibacter terrae TaxID=2732511 RepID=A0ABX6P456_9BURK|nr:hypothetical protein HK414_12995 [Ramlibacter terrae]
MNADTFQAVGRWVAQKWQGRLRDSDGDYFTVATQMRKQGLPVELALMLLCGSACTGLEVGK